MNRLIKITALVFTLGFMVSPAVMAGDELSPVIPVTADVDTAAQFTINIREEVGKDPGTGDPIFGPAIKPPAMNHGTLVRDFDADTGEPFALRGKAFHVWLGAGVNVPYTIKSTMGELSAGGNNLPHAIGLFPISARRAGVDVGTLVAAQDAIGTNKLIYTSNELGQGATIELVYGLSGGNADGTDPFPGWQPVPPDQAPGSYVSTLVYTLTT